MANSPTAVRAAASMKILFDGWESERHYNLRKQMKRFNRLTADTLPSADRFLKIGEVAKATGIGIEALRFYEKSGLLDRPSALRQRSGLRSRSGLRHGTDVFR